MDKNTIKAEYTKLSGDRDIYLDRAKELAKLTIPYLYPEDEDVRGGYGRVNPFKTTYQSIGARGVNNIASKLLITLLPPNTSFFRLVLDEYELAKIAPTDESDSLKTDIDDGFSKVEQAVVGHLESNAVRSTTFVMLKHLVVGGNVLLYVHKDASIKLFRLDRYVLKRDPMGNPVKIITKEDISIHLLPSDIRDKIKMKRSSMGNDSYKDDSVVCLFTRMTLKGDEWEYVQEADGELLPSTRQMIPKDSFPYLPLRIVKIDGEDYGPGLAEDMAGDLMSLAVLQQALNDGANLAARVLFLLKPGSLTDKESLETARNGAVVQGDRNDIQTLQLEKNADFQYVDRVITRLQDSLGMSFLLNTSIQRSGERVTAEEIRYMAQELEDTLGGVYSILAQEFQLPLVQILMRRLAALGKLPELPTDLVKVAVVTGLSALGRTREQTNLERAMGLVIQALGPQEAIRRLKVGNVIKRIFSNLGIDDDELIKSEEELQMEMQQAQQMQLQQQIANQAIQSGGKALEQPGQ